MTATFADQVSLIRSESERLTQYLQHLPSAAWEAASACDLWQVQDVVAHLVEVAGLYTNSVTRGLSGDSEPPEGRLPAGAVNASIVAASVAQRSIATRQRLGSDLLDTFKQTGDRLNDLLADLKPEDRDKLCYHPGGIVPARRFIDLRLKELATHEWDMRSPHEPDFELSPLCIPAILGLITDSIASGSLRWGFWAGETLPTPIRYQFNLSGPASVQTEFVIDGGQVKVDKAREAPQVVVNGSAQAFILLVYGRLPLAEALQTGRLVAEGDDNYIEALGEWFKGV